MKAALREVVLTDMRMQLVHAKNGTVFINDAYNAAPTSMKAAIKFIEKSTLKKEKWLVLGDMLELGEQEKEFHEEIGLEISHESFQGVCLFGPRMFWLYEKLKDKFSADQIIWTEDNYNEIISFLQNKINSDSLVLVKGSRGMQLEKIMEPFLKQ